MKRVADEADATLLAQAIADPSRERPIVAISFGAWRTSPLVDVDELSRSLGESADLYVVKTGPATWELAEHLPKGLEIFGDALRVWWPDFVPADDPRDHPLFVIYRSVDAERKHSELLAELGIHSMPADQAPGRPRPGDVVDGVVTELVEYGVFLDVGGHRGLVHVSELSDDWVNDPGEVVEVGDEVKARVLKTDDGQLAFSFRAAPGDDGSDVSALREELAQAKSEIRGLAEERAQLLAERSRLKERVRQLERTRRNERPRERAPIENEQDFRALVELEYRARYVGDDLVRWPLREYRLHPEFIESVFALGFSVEKIAEVTAHVVSGRAHELPGLDVHPLRDGKGGAAQRERAADGAKAWRCALQREAAGARRLHWWAREGNLIELASVGHHDDFGIPD